MTSQQDVNTGLLASCAEGKLDKLRDYVKAGADVNCRDGQGFTPVMVAVGRCEKSGTMKKHFKLLEALVELGADLNIPDKWGNTPLMEAVQTCDISLVEYLLWSGAEVDRKTPLGVSVLTMAMKMFNPYFTYQRLDLLKLLLQRGANPNTADVSGNTPLAEAIRLENVDFVAALLQCGADANTIVDDNTIIDDENSRLSFESNNVMPNSEKWMRNGHQDKQNGHPCMQNEQITKNKRPGKHNGHQGRLNWSHHGFQNGNDQGIHIGIHLGMLIGQNQVMLDGPQVILNWNQVMQNGHYQEIPADRRNPNGHQRKQCEQPINDHQTKHFDQFGPAFSHKSHFVPIHPNGVPIQSFISHCGLPITLPLYPPGMHILPIKQRCPPTESQLPPVDFYGAPLHIAVKSMGSKNSEKGYVLVPILNLLLEYGADVNLADNLGFTPLTLAVVRNDMSAVSLLLSSGLKVDISQALQASARLMRSSDAATFWDYMKLVMMLIDHGADYNIPDSRGNTPLVMAVAAVAGLEYSEVKDILKSDSPSFTKKSSTTKSSLLNSILRRRERFPEFPKWIVEVLLENFNIDLNAGDDSGETPLMVAVEVADAPAISFLLKSGADPNVSDKRDVSLLNRAIRRILANGFSCYHPFEILERLVIHGGNVVRFDTSDFTKPISELLQESGLVDDVINDLKNYTGNYLLSIFKETKMYTVINYIKYSALGRGSVLSLKYSTALTKLLLWNLWIETEPIDRKRVLHCAIVTGSGSLLKLILKFGATQKYLKYETLAPDYDFTNMLAAYSADPTYTDRCLGFQFLQSFEITTGDLESSASCKLVPFPVNVQLINGFYLQPLPMVTLCYLQVGAAEKCSTESQSKSSESNDLLQNTCRAIEWTHE